MLLGPADRSSATKTTQAKPVTPVTMNAHCHPHRSVIHGTTSGVTSAPTLVPELKMPVASARSLGETTPATVLMAAGKVAGLANAQGEAGQRKTCRRPVTNDGKAGRGIEIKGRQAQIREPIRRRVADRGKTPKHHRQRKSQAHSEFVHDSSCQQQADGIGKLKTEHGGVDPFVLPVKLLHERRLQDADHLPVDVIDGRREKEQGADDPSEVTGSLRPDGSGNWEQWAAPVFQNVPPLHFIPPTRYSCGPPFKTSGFPCGNRAAPPSPPLGNPPETQILA